MNRIIIFTAASGTGKGKLAEIVEPEHPEMERVTSHTTRLPRPGEIPGKTNHYHYVTSDVFLAMRARNEMVEDHLSASGYWYGTSKQSLNEALSRSHVFHEIEVNGAQKIQTLFPQAISIFVLPPTYAELERRLRQRATETEEEIVKRLATSKLEVAKIHSFDYVIENDDLHEAAAKISHLIGQLLAGERPNPSDFCFPERIRQITATFR